MFIVGSWNDCIELSLDINEAFSKYSQGTLTLSAGIGMYHNHYPMSRMAHETGKLEGMAKNADAQKNKIALFEPDGMFSWDVLREQIIGKKLRTIQSFFRESDERGKAMIYKLLDYLRNADSDRINIPRLAYLLARLEPRDEGKKAGYADFMRKFYEWALDKKERGELETALELYIYLHRREQER